MTTPRDYLLEHLIAVPAFRALLRSIEARMIGEREWPRPILDLGCGDGHFAQAAFVQPLDAGIDPSTQAIGEARRRGMHRALETGDSKAMPFPDGAFATVLSNSVLEHIPDIDATLRETHRVLKPGGLFVFTTPNQHYAEYLFFPDLFTHIGLTGLAARYGAFFNRIAHHYRTDSAPVWTERLMRHGFAVRECRTYFSRDASHVFDLAHYYSAPTILFKFLFGRWIIAPWRANFALIEPLWRRFYDEPPLDDGVSLFFVCERK
jgi:SAM-dependent methyltransferase